MNQTLRQQIIRISNGDMVSRIRTHITDDEQAKLIKVLAAYGGGNIKVAVLPHYLSEEEYKLKTGGNC